MPGDGGFRIRTGEPDDVDRALELLRTSYGWTRFDREWHAWKQQECPFGAARLVVAEDDEDGMIGVFFALPWPYVVRGEPIDGTRTVDGGTLPASRGRGVLGALIHDELRLWGPERPGIVVATATEAAQRSHAKNHAVTLPPIVSRYGVPRSLRPARLVHGHDLLDSYAAPDDGLLHTAWTPDALRWRIDPRSGHQYEVASLAHADSPNGLIYRVQRHRALRTLLPVLSWGTSRDERRLLGAAAIAAGCPTVLAPAGPGTHDPGMRPLRAGSDSILCVWDTRGADAAAPAGTASSWSLMLAELEGLI